MAQHEQTTRERIERLEALASSLVDRFISANNVTARQFLVMDPSTGKPRAEFGIRSDGSVALVQRDADGTTRIDMSVRADGAPAFVLRDRRGIARMMVRLDGDDDPIIQLVDASGKPRINIVEKEDSPQIVLTDPAGRPRCVVMVAPNGNPVMVKLDEQGNELE